MARMVPIEHFCCQNSDCPQAGVRGDENLYFRGWSGKSRRIRMVYCRTCKRSFSERKGTVLEQARLPDEKALAVLKHLREGCGTRATGRLVEVDKNTVTRYLAKAGPHAEKLHDELVALSPPDPRGPGR
jgi:transposase-like protein